MIVCENLVKIYKTEETEVVALQGLELTVDAGEMIAIIGNSGSGKSTLLNMLGGLDRPSAGTLTIDGHDMLKMTQAQYVQYKRDTVGFVWQNNARNLIPYLTALENVEVPMMFAKKRDTQRARELLKMVGLEKRMNNRLGQLSGGEQQRVAIAISLANSPKLVLADEPSGAVDTRTSRIIMQIFKEANQNLNVTVVIVTHDRSLARQVDRVVAIRDGRTSSEFVRRKSYQQELQEIEASMQQEEQERQQVELVVIDSAGRLQIPREYLDAMGIKGKQRMKLEMHEGRVVVDMADEEHRFKS